jgi:plastocyanin
VNVKTGVATMGTKTFTIKLVKGKYTFVCDPHASFMKGSFTIK